MITYVHARQALLPTGWASNVRIAIESGAITTIIAGVPSVPGDDRHAIVIPGIPNLHSHAFQRGMAGLAEVGRPAGDSFWTWREVMNRFAQAITPDHLEAIALMAHVEMLEAGFTRVAEFHSLHHDRYGAPYSDIGEMAGRIVIAAKRSGIRLTLLPVFYAYGGFGELPPTHRQKQSVTDMEQYVRIVHRCRELLDGIDGAVLGLAPHSLRAVNARNLAAIATMLPSGPIHIQIAEQTKEVEACIGWSGQRPVDWLLDHLDIDNRWCLIHATHLDARETNRLGRSGAIVGLCPITEANLGDGVFRGREFLAAQGAFGIGTDSTVQISAAAELRQLEYSQRLARRERNVMTISDRATARMLVEMAIEGGSRATGAPLGGLAPASPADMVSLTSDRADLGSGDRAVSAWIFTDRVQVDTVWVGGDDIVRGGLHRHRDETIARYQTAMRSLAHSRL